MLKPPLAKWRTPSQGIQGCFIFQTLADCMNFMKGNSQRPCHFQIRQMRWVEQKMYHYGRDWGLLPFFSSLDSLIFQASTISTKFLHSLLFSFVQISVEIKHSSTCIRISWPVELDLSRTTESITLAQAFLTTCLALCVKDKYLDFCLDLAC